MALYEGAFRPGASDLAGEADISLDHPDISVQSSANNQPGAEKARLRQIASTIAISSVSGGSGKSITAVNLAATLALTGKHAVLVDLAFGSRPLRNLLGMDKAEHTIKDYLSGKIKTLKKAVRKTPFYNLSLVESGIDFFNFTDKTLRLKKNLIKKFSRLGADYVIFDLGLISDHVKLDYFLNADIPLVLTEPDETSTAALKRLMLNLAARAVETGFRKTPLVKKEAALLKVNNEWNGSTFIDEVKKQIASNPALIKKLTKLANRPLAHLLVNRVKTGNHLKFGPDIKKTLQSVTGMEIVYLGFIPEDALLASMSLNKSPV
ncbi:hypothetical protein MNBD_NITROSPINAE03-743, partial [hydrothermal vent metagenome]